MFWLTLLAFLVILGLLIFVHEAGHFIVAKLSGVKVEEFAFGFPPRLIGFQAKKIRELKELVTREEIKIEIEDVKSGATEKIKETITEDADTSEKVRTRWNWKFAWGHRAVSKLLEAGIKSDQTTYGINLIPFGGYVKMLGEEKDNGSPRAFNKKKPGTRLMIVVAGVVMNFLLAGVIFSVGYMVGMSPIRLDATELGGRQTHQVVIAQVADNSAAKSAGIQVGDIVLGYDSVNAFSDFTHTHPGATVPVSVLREGKITDLSVTLSKDEAAPLGVGIVDVPVVQLPFFKAIYFGFKEMILTTGYIFILLYGFFVKLFSSGRVAADVAGPVGIFNITGQAVRMGLAYLLQLAAILSINLGIINILPFPALDGGRAFLIGLEGIFRRRVIRSEIENTLHFIGFAILILLIAAITVREVIALF